MLSEGHDDDEQPDPGPRRQLIAAMVLLGLLLVVGLWLTGVLRGAANLQDCVASGRTNCAPVEAPAR